MRRAAAACDVKRKERGMPRPYERLSFTSIAGPLLRV